jgi:hypothetical protein
MLSGAVWLAVAAGSLRPVAVACVPLVVGWLTAVCAASRPAGTSALTATQAVKTISFCLDESDDFAIKSPKNG